MDWRKCPGEGHYFYRIPRGLRPRIIHHCPRGRHPHHRTRCRREVAEPGNILVNGTLIANGTAEKKIIITSVWDDAYGGKTDPSGGDHTAPGEGWCDSGYCQANYWGQITFSPTSTNSVINQTLLVYGGSIWYAYASGPSPASLLSIQSSSVTVSNSTISHSYGTGIAASNASPTITGSTISGNGSDGIDLYSSSATVTNNTVSNNLGGAGISVVASSPAISGNTINGNSSYGLLYSGDGMLDARNNDWGDPSGPLDSIDDRATGGLYNPLGKGDQVSDYVNYYPWVGITVPLTLSSGWNFVSFQKLPSALAAVEAVLSDCYQSLLVAWGYDNEHKEWKKHKPGNSGTLSTLDAGKGYWIFLDNPRTLFLDGNDALPSLLLYEGWNLIGYAGQDNKDITYGLGSPIDGRWSTIWTWDGGVWHVKYETTLDLPNSIQPLTTLRRGKAYWIKIKPGVGQLEWVQ